MIDYEVGEFVRTSDDIISRVDDISDLHNVYVTFFRGGVEVGNGLYCEVEDCPHYDPLKVLEDDGYET